MKDVVLTHSIYSEHVAGRHILRRNSSRRLWKPIRLRLCVDGGVSTLLPHYGGSLPLHRTISLFLLHALLDGVVNANQQVGQDASSWGWLRFRDTFRTCQLGWFGLPKHAVDFFVMLSDRDGPSDIFDSNRVPACRRCRSGKSRPSSFDDERSNSLAHGVAARVEIRVSEPTEFWLQCTSEARESRAISEAGRADRRIGRGEGRHHAGLRAFTEVPARTGLS